MRVITIAHELTDQDALNIIRISADWLKSHGIVHYVLDVSAVETVSKGALDALAIRSEYLHESYRGGFRIAGASEGLRRHFDLFGHRLNFRFYANATVATASCSKGAY